ncbi:hypothetical protein V8C35DRAFT_304277 [Trichoderma chlorosporum]
MDANFRQSLRSTSSWQWLRAIIQLCTPSNFPIPSLHLATADHVDLMQRPLLYFRLIACCHNNLLRLIPSPLVGSRRLALISAYLDDWKTGLSSRREKFSCNTLCVREIWELIMPECGRVSHQTPQHLCYCARIIPTCQHGCQSCRTISKA